MKKSLTSILFFVLSITVSMAQIKYEKRIEIEEKEGYSNYQTYQFAESGIVVSYEKDMKSGDLAEYYFDFYNSDLELTDSKKVAISDKMSTDFTCGTEKTGHAFLSDRKNNYVLLSLDVNKNELKKVSGTFPKKLYLREMVAMGDYVYLYGYIKKNQTMVSINWKTGKTKMSDIDIPNVKPKKVMVQGFQVHDATDEVFLFLQARPDKKTSDVYMMRADQNGQKKGLINISDKTSSYILTATASALEEDNYIFMGTYSDKSANAAQGFYFSKSEKNKMQFIRFYPFAEMKNFLDYLPKNQQAKLEKKIQKKKDKGKKVDISYNMVLHDLIVQADGYVVIGECYYATYRTETYTTTSYVNGRPVTTTQTRQVFDGYFYTHAVVMKLGFDGKLLWSKNFKMNAAEKPFRVIKFIKVSLLADEEISMIYADYNKLVAKSIDKHGKVIRDVEQEVVISSKSGDKVKYTNSDLRPWYDNYFLAYGYQRIKNKEDKSVKKKRNVFYLSKVKYVIENN